MKKMETKEKCEENDLECTYTQPIPTVYKQIAKKITGKTKKIRYHRKQIQKLQNSRKYYIDQLSKEKDKREKPPEQLKKYGRWQTR